MQTTGEPRETSGSSSAWMASATVPEYPPLAADVRADVCVVGAGIAGLTSAYMLLREGKSVVVIDRAGVGAGETGRSTAHFFPPDERYCEIERAFGSGQAALVADSYREATACVEAIVRTERIDCEFERVDGYLFNPHGEWEEVLEREYAVTTRLGLNVGRFERVPGLHFDTGPCLRFARQAQLHPLKYLDGLAKAITTLGGRIHDTTRALDMEGDASRQTVRTGAGSVTAGAVVIATNVPFNAHEAMQSRQAAHRTYVIGLKVPKHAIPRMLLWDTGDPYYYARLAAAPEPGNHELLIVGGRDHKTGQDPHPASRYAEIEAWVRARFPMAGPVEYRWSGEIMQPSDGIAYLGRAPAGDANVYVITGDSGNGMTHGTAGAILVTDLILGRPNTWSVLYAPERRPFHGVPDFLGGRAAALPPIAGGTRGLA